MLSEPGIFLEDLGRWNWPGFSYVFPHPTLKLIEVRLGNVFHRKGKQIRGTRWITQ